jgi:hypothetical protein
LLWLGTLEQVEHRELDRAVTTAKDSTNAVARAEKERIIVNLLLKNCPAD